MMVSRRVLLKNIAISSAGLVLLPSCGFSGNEPLGAAAQKLGLNPGDEAFLKAFCHLLLPVKYNDETKEKTGLHPFVLTMVADCHAPEDRARFTAGLKACRKITEDVAGGSIEKTPAAQLMPLLKEWEARNDDQNPLYFFYHLTKDLVISGYTGSQYFLTSVQPYKLVPGKYQGCE